jgi:RNA polymerase sigma-54 factor
MRQGLIQTQSQQQTLSQTLSPQQLLQVRLLELPLNEMEQRINTEMDDNPALEIGEEHDENLNDDTFTNDSDSNSENSQNEDFETQQERDERQSALDDALTNMTSDEELPVYTNSGNSSSEDNEYDMATYMDNSSFYDNLKEQMAEHELTDNQKDVMEYLIGSLDDDGLLRKSVPIICDELAVYHNIYVTEEDIEDVLEILHDFDPAGIGARTLQECLLLQIERRNDSRLKELMNEVIKNNFDDFKLKHWDKIQQKLNLNELQKETLNKELCKLNPKPGASLGEAVGRNFQQITPDFIIDTHDDGTISFSLNNGNIPDLHVSQSFADTLSEYQNNKENMSRQMKEALLYTKKKIESAQGFIDAIKQRRQTLFVTMKAIINLQHKFFEEGDEGLLKPMILKDVADKTGFDISTISRVSNSKYAQTRWGTFPLKYFFSDSYTTENGEELSTRKIKITLQDIIDNEDKQHPLSDDIIKDELEKRGLPIARRTVAKYREQLGIPIARLRK